CGLAGPAPAPARGPGAGARRAARDLGRVVAVVLGGAVAADPRRVRTAVVTVTVALAGPGQGQPPWVPSDGLVRLIQLEVGGGGVEKQQVDLEVQQRGDLAEHLAFQLAVDL